MTTLEERVSKLEDVTPTLATKQDLVALARQFKELETRVGEDIDQGVKTIIAAINAKS